MQIWEFSVWVSVALCFVLWGGLQTGCAFVGQKLPKAWFSPNNWYFRPKKFEQGGAFYKRVFKIQKWKKYLPDGAAVMPKGYRKKHLTDISANNMELFLEQSCRAEFGHLLAITPFWVFGFFLPPISIVIMLVYALLVNGPCIIAQRYNRPRIQALLTRMEKQNGV